MTMESKVRYTILGSLFHDIDRVKTRHLQNTLLSAVMDQVNIAVVAINFVTFLERKSIGIMTFRSVTPGNNDLLSQY